MSKYGFVYCLLSHSLPDLYKIGCTERSPTQRAEELSHGTGVPSEYYVVAYIECAGFQTVERDIHRRLDQYRPNGNREFFRAPLDEIAAHMFHHPASLGWVDRIMYENIGVKPWQLADPYRPESLRVA
jgi:hypothetical protein